MSPEIIEISDEEIKFVSGGCDIGAQAQQDDDYPQIDNDPPG